ncbi:MAG: amino acid ABC transporter substrate-binding protein [Geminicoccaceae bacterium]
MSIAKAFAVLALLIAATGAARSETVLERIARTDTLTAGTRADAAPFAFRAEDGSLQGFSVDLLTAIVEALQRDLGRHITLELEVVTSQSRVPAIQSGEIEIECGITTPTWAREDLIDFSLPFFENGTRVLALRSTARQLSDLAGKRVGVPVGSTTLYIVRRLVPDLVPVEIEDMNTGLAMLERGELAGLANIGVVLRGLIENSRQKNLFVLLPRTGALSYESMACMLPKDDSAWRDFVNHTLSDLLEGIDQYRGGYYDIYERWFGASGYLFYPLDREVAKRLAGSRVWLN